MTPIKTIVQQFSIIGIAVKTNNLNGQSQLDVGALWQKFFKDNIISLIPGKLSEDIYCMYTDYESDADGYYTTILGCKVSSLKHIPEGFVGKNIMETTYLLYRSFGKLPDSVVATWKSIWQTPIKRAYLADFDVYGNKSQDANNMEVETYVSIQ